MNENAVVIGADIGGSHITAATVELNRLQVLPASHSRISISTNAGPDELIAAWAGCIQKAAAGSAIEKVCLAMPGPFRYEEGICLIRDQNKYPGLYNINVKNRLAEALLVDPSMVHMYNDAACFIMGEVCCGSLIDTKSAIGITLGTGLGTAVFKEGAAHSADLWNMPFFDSIAEEYLSSRWFTAEYFKQTGKLSPGVKELTALAHTEEKVRLLFDTFARNLATFLKKFIALASPDAIVIGGNIAHAFPFFGERLLSELHQLHPSVKIVKSLLGENASLIGAVSSWINISKRSLAD